MYSYYNTPMHIRAAFIIFLFTMMMSLPIFIDPLLDRASDLDGNITQILYIKNSLVQHHTFPQWNPYINQGIPVSADPLHAAFHPLVLPIFTLFSPESAVRILYALSLFMGGLGMYYLLHRLKIHPTIAYISAGIFITSGYISSHLVAGHFEKVLSFAFLPWFIHSLYAVYKKPGTSYQTVTACLMSLMVFSGDLYNALYSVLLVLAAGVIRLRRSHILSSIRIVIYFLLLSAIKLVPLFELQNHINKVREPFAGSQNFISILYYFFLPIKPLFISLGLSSYLTTGFAWWEKVAFVGPMTLVGIVLFFSRRKIFFQKQAQFFIGLMIILVLLSMPAFSVNPFNWAIHLIPQLQLFHVPSRVFGMLTVILLSISAIGFQRWYVLKEKKYTYAATSVLIINLTMTTAFFIFIMGPMNMPLNHSDTSNDLVKDIKRRDKSIFYISQYLQEFPLQQHKTISLEQKILNSNYGLQLKDSPAAAFTQFDFATDTAYADIQPRYIVGGEAIRIPRNTQPNRILKQDNIYLYKNVTATPYAYLEGQKKEVDNVQIKPNSITVRINSSQTDTLTIHESSFPGWTAYQDSMKLRLNSGRFLSIPITSGTHTYQLRFYSYSFMLGLGISIVSWSIAISLLFRHYKRSHT